MSSKSRRPSGASQAQLIIGVVLGAVLMGLSQWPWHRKVEALERQIAQLQSQAVRVRQGLHRPMRRLGELMNHALEPVGSQARYTEWDVPAASYAPSVAAEPVQAPVQVASAKPAVKLEEPESLGVVSEAELDRIVAGAGVPPPGPIAPHSVLPPGGDLAAEEAASRPVRRVEKGGVLLRKGRTQVEPTVSYTHVSNDRVGLSGFSLFDVIFIGEIRSDEVDRDIITSSLDVRHGLTDRLQGEISLPMQMQREEVESGPIDKRVRSVKNHRGFSDVGAGLSYQIMREQGNMPAMITHLKVKAPTGEYPNLGSGSWGIKGGLTMLKTSDPVVLFSNLAYNFTMPMSLNGVQINPGNSVELSAGMAYALNYNLVFNGGIEQSFVSEATSNGSPVIGSRLVVANLKTGLTYALTKNLSVDLSLATGLTEDSPDLTVSVSLPYTF